MTRLRGTVKPDLSEWTLDTTDRLEEFLGPIIKTAAAEALHLAMEEDAHICFPAVYGKEEDGCGNPAPDDPLTIYIRVALTSESEPVTYAFTLREALQGHLEECAEDDSYNEGLKRIGDALRALAAEIDQAVKPR